MPKKHHHQGQWKGRKQYGRAPNKSNDKDKYPEGDFINPYNFVPFESGNPPPKAKPPSHENFAGLSGRITCEIETLTPLAIPDGEKIYEQPEGHKVKPLLLIDDKPYIPGASIKGAIRSVMEAATNSCMSVLTENMAVFRDNRSHTIKDRAVGKMIGKTVAGKGERADRFDAPNKHIDFLRIGLFNQNERRSRKPYFTRPNYPRAGGTERIPEEIAELYHKMIGDENFTFLDKDNPEEGAKKPEDMQPDYIARTTPLWLKNYRNHSINRKFPKDWHNPHWFFRTTEIDGRDYIIQFGRNFRFKWSYNPRDAIPNSFHPCTEPDHLCPVCALLGMASQETSDERSRHQAKVNARAGRVAFGAAACISEWEQERIECLKTLNTPKPSCRSFYLFPQDGRRDDKSVAKEEYVELKNGKLRTTPARGRKFYWHHASRWQDGGNRKAYFQKLPPRGQQRTPTRTNSSVDVVRPGARFEFTIEFENLSETELGMLLWTLTLPEDGNLAHHLGGGKPLGLGSVKITAQKVTLIDRARRYENLFDLGENKSFSDHAAAIDFSAPQNEALKNYLDAFREQLKAWNQLTEPEKGLRDIPHMHDLLTMLNLDRPLPGEAQSVRISYPPGSPGKDKDDTHYSELHYTWFGSESRDGGGGYGWGQRLLRVDEIRANQKQKYKKKKGQ